MARRPKGDGTIYKRATDDRWVGAVVVDGRRVARYGTTREEVRRKLDAVKRDRDKGLPIVEETQTLAQFVANWLETVQPTVRARTWRRYRELLELHVVPELGKTRLAKLTPSQVQRLYSHLLGSELSSTTVWHLHAVLHRALETALRLGLVQRNVTEMVERPRPADHEMRVLLPGEIAALLTVAEGNRLEALYTLALATGMRQGELLALKWRDVDLEAGSLQVRATLQWQDGRWVFAPPKTKKSRRRIALPGAAVKALVAHRLRQMEEQRTLGDTWQDQGLVFCSTIGTPLDAAHVVRRSFFPLLAKAGVPRIRFHDLRHTAATMMLMRRVNPKVVSEVLGHASVSITLDIYSHVLPDMQEDAASAMDAVLGERITRSVAGRLLADYEQNR